MLDSYSFLCAVVVLVVFQCCVGRPVPVVSRCRGVFRYCVGGASAGGMPVPVVFLCFVGGASAGGIPVFCQWCQCR